MTLVATTEDPDRLAALKTHLLTWGSEHRKKFPWRYSTDPYRVLVAEFMLHRTQATQASRVYQEFIGRWPTLEDFASSEPEEAEKVLEPLGLRWRVRAMIQALHFSWQRYREIPLEAEMLRNIPGVGDYIAGATVCFATNAAVTLIDTNSVRVIGRLFGLNLEGEARRRKEIREAISKACPSDEPRDFYYSIIDLAHEICRPTEPDCANCPLLRVPCMHGMELIGTSLA